VIVDSDQDHGIILETKIWDENIYQLQQSMSMAVGVVVVVQVVATWQWIAMHTVCHLSLLQHMWFACVSFAQKRPSMCTCVACYYISNLSFSYCYLYCCSGCCCCDVDTLIVWNDPSTGQDWALSFAREKCCTEILYVVVVAVVRGDVDVHTACRML
jgi:hypothetical protein